MRTLSIGLVCSLLLLTVAGAQTFQDLRAEGERQYEEKSFSRARASYARAAQLTLSPEERRWVEMRLADTAWRADEANREESRKALEEIVRSEPHDRTWAEANESLGDLHGVHGGMQYYQAALDFWAGSSDLDLARARYLGLVWKISRDGNIWAVPRQVLVNAISIAATRGDRDRARLYLATQLTSEGSLESMERAVELAEEVIAGGPGEHYADALYLAATQLASMDRFGAEASDYERALAYFRRIVRELQPSETPFHDDAQRAIDEITAPMVHVQVPGTFLPGAEQEILLSWRNVAAVDLTLTPIDLTRDALLDEKRDWIETVRTDGRAAERSWRFETQSPASHRPGNELIGLTPALKTGAYLLSARAGGKTARALVLVSNLHVTTHRGRNQLQIFLSDVVTGEPAANATLRVQKSGAKPSDVTLRTDASGLAKVLIGDYGSLLITASAGGRQAWHRTWTGGHTRAADDSWRVYAFTDRPAYRPGETVQWKIIARARNGERWTTPAGSTLEYEIHNPRGEKVASGTATLNAFGSFWSDLPVTSAMPLGEYSIVFRRADTARRPVALAQLFRLEEYKLPEFVVSVATPEGKQYRLGDTIEATIDASYYFGGPVANASVVAVVHQQPFHRWWRPRHEYHWYFAPPPHHYGESVVREETLTTDANGRAILRIPTPRDGNDMSYRIEARVVDASRREVRGEGTVRVTRQRYSVNARPEHNLYRKGETVTVEFEALDANDRPVRTTGTVTVVRRRWRERWIEPLGRRIDAGRYEDEPVLTTKLDTSTSGRAELTFTPDSNGYYVVRWTSSDGDAAKARDQVTAETMVWVTDRAGATDLGYRSAGLDVIVDRESVRRGDTLPVMIAAPASGRWVLLTTSGDDILQSRVIHLTANATVVEIPIEDLHVPNFFVTASSVFNRQIATDTEQVIVPPVEHFLTVEVKTDREEYEPRDEATVTVTTRDASGRPVAAEVALAVADDAVTAIQTDLAGDPRPFFFGELRPRWLEVSAALHEQRYIAAEDQRPDGESDVTAGGREREEAFRRGGIGAVAGDLAAQSVTTTAEAAATMPMSPVQTSPPPPPAPSMKAANAVDGSISVEVRTDFRTTAFWKPDLVTDAAGTATVRVRLPDSLTTWRATARAATTGSEFGMDSSTVRTNMPLMVRLQSPRFFVVGDRATVSAVINNNTDAEVTVTPALELSGAGARLDSEAGATPVRIAANGDVRAEWTVIAESAGEVTFRVTAKSATHADAMEKAITVHEHGIEKLIARSGKLRGDEAVIRLDLPRDRRATELAVQIAPSLAVTMLDAVPYLIEFPYGCTEQTMSRFLPAAIVARTLESLGVSRAEVEARVLTQKPVTVRPSSAGPRAPADLRKLDEVIAAGSARLYDMQHGDGGWGWWKEGDSDEFMTAYVVWGFALARDGGMPVRTAAVERAWSWLQRRLVEKEGAWSDQAWMLHAMSAWKQTGGTAETRAFDAVWQNRERLTPYSRALLALTAHRYGSAERARTLVRNLEDGVQIDRTPDQSVLLPGTTAAETMATAHWGSTNRFWWRWYEGPVETTAFVLRALVTIDPAHELVEPAMNWLVKNRRGAQWNNTRDTAIALLALNDYLKQSGELRSGVSYEVTVNGKQVASRTIEPAEALRAPSRLIVDASLLAAERQEIRIRRTGGAAPLYFSAEARFVSLEEPVKAAGNEIFVRREYFRLAPRPTLLKGMQYDRVALRDGESIGSGERVEVVVTVETKNDYEYLMFEDLKPAGFEAVELQSGQPLFALDSKRQRRAFIHQELRDRQVALFADRLAQGIWEIRYTLRAETPGTFHALPLLGQAMYVPEIRANGDEVRVVVR